MASLKIHAGALPRFHHLKTLILELCLDALHFESPDGVAENVDIGSELPQSLDSLTFEIKADPHPHPGCKFWKLLQPCLLHIE